MPLSRNSFRFSAGGPGQGRLSKSLVENKKALSASMSFQAQHDPGIVMVSAGLNMEQSLDDVKKTIFETIDGIAKEPPSQEELDRVKNRLLRGMEQRLSDSQQLGLGMTQPISLYYFGSPNSRKVTILLEELGATSTSGECASRLSGRSMTISPSSFAWAATRTSR